MSSLSNNIQNENLSSNKPKILISQKVKTITLDSFIIKKKLNQLILSKLMLREWNFKF